jgi:hypothetical protein
VQELTRLGLLESGTAEIRVHPCSPLFKLYILNGEEVFFGLYPIIRQRIPLPGGDRDIYDLMGKDAVVFHHFAQFRPRGPCRSHRRRPGGAAPALRCRSSSSRRSPSGRALP